MLFFFFWAKGVGNAGCVSSGESGGGFPFCLPKRFDSFLEKLMGGKILIGRGFLLRNACNLSQLFSLRDQRSPYL